MLERLEKEKASIARKVHELRRERRWTQAELARHLDLSQGRLSEIERGDGSFTAEQFLAILRLFNVTASDFATTAAGPRADLQNALARIGALQLQESTDVLPSERLGDVNAVIREVIVASELPRQVHRARARTRDQHRPHTHRAPLRAARGRRAREAPRMGGREHPRGAPSRAPCPASEDSLEAPVQPRPGCPFGVPRVRGAGPGSEPGAGCARREHPEQAHARGSAGRVFGDLEAVGDRHRAPAGGLRRGATGGSWRPSMSSSRSWMRAGSGTSTSWSGTFSGWRRRRSSCQTGSRDRATGCPPPWPGAVATFFASPATPTTVRNRGGLRRSARCQRTRQPRDRDRLVLSAAFLPACPGRGIDRRLAGRVRFKIRHRPGRTSRGRSGSLRLTR